MKTKNILMIIFGAIAFAINFYIVYEGFVPVESSAATSVGFAETLINIIKSVVPSSNIDSNPEAVHAVVRKLFGHFLLFGASGLFTGLCLVMLGREIVGKELEIFLSGLAAGLSVSIFSEVAQLFAPGRFGLFTDVLIDFAGFVVFFAITFIVAYLIIHKKNKEVMN